MKRIICLSISCFSIFFFAGTTFPQTSNLDYSSSSDSALIYSIYPGGSDDDSGRSISVESGSALAGQ
ncbi:MAG: hypothetical protein U9N73_01825 [Candidatus Auribacterota bacterium]|nr:hypothetical protein [Candidatus Auribacterota bacterium]